MRTVMAWLVAACVGGAHLLGSQTPKPPAGKPTGPAAVAAVPAKPGSEPSGAQARAASGPATGHPDTTAQAGGSPGTATKRKPAVLDPAELVIRIQRILDEQAARQRSGDGSVASAAAGSRSRGKPIAPARGVRHSAPGLQESVGVRLAWERDIDPRRPAPTGVRLTWPEDRD
jgi:hypothetical protein